MPKSIDRLRERGQSVWLDFIHRGMLDSGELERYVREGWITGLTSNPTIFNKAIAGSAQYDDALRAASRDGTESAYDAFVGIAGDDLRRAADIFRSVYDATEGADGYVSFEAPPGIEDDAEATVREAHRLREAVGRPNVMIKVPGTAAGVDALRELTAQGTSVNVTLLFGVGVYERVAEAYIEGLERRLEQGQPLDGIASVASFFVSRLDSKIDGWLPEDSELGGAAAVANARVAYQRFLTHFSGPRWERLAAAGARVQRPLWASTSTKNPSYSDVLYVDDLVAADTVNTMPEPTLLAFADHGNPEGGIDERTMAEARAALDRLATAGIDLSRATDELLDEGLASFAGDFRALLDCIDASVSTLRDPAYRSDGTALGALAPAVAVRVATLASEEAVRRLWAHDHTLWAEQPREIADRLGWLTVDEELRGHVEEIEGFARQVIDAGYRTAVLMGMGGSSLAAEVLTTTFGQRPGALELVVLDTTDPQQIAGVADRLEAGRTLFIAASKSGGTIETRSQLDLFFERAEREGSGAGRHFVAITDPGTPLAALAEERGFRRVFENPPEIGGRYSALSYFGLVPAALAGVPIGALLDRAAGMRRGCHTCVPVADNPGAWLGAVLGEAAAAGRDKLTLVLPKELASLGTWIEQLVAESTGKQGQGILPVEGEPLGPPERYGDDRLFVVIGEPNDGAALDALALAGHPVVRLPYDGPEQLGAEFFRWEFATAIAGHVLGVHPFDQPNVQEAKDATARGLAGETVDESTPTAAEVLATVTPGDYVAILAYVPRNEENDRWLQAARIAIRDRYRVATTVGYGPRFLHSTGQLHKGGPPSGVFLQLVGEDEVELPIPGTGYDFGTLKRAQAAGDLASLQALGRRVARVTEQELRALAT
jgi:transaldolase/glucose-6-phosphate isomerase